MNTQVVIQNAWHQIEYACYRRSLCNQDTFIFAFCKSIPKTFTIIYDGRNQPDNQHKPNFFILNNDDRSLVTFIGRLRFGSLDDEFVCNDLAQLKHFLNKTEISVLTEAKENKETKIQVDEAAQIGYFLLANIAWLSVEKKLKNIFTDDDRKLVHIALGPVTYSPGPLQQFKYYSPKPEENR